ncbi:hypothetical protein [Legionella hackeliae]|uniref:J domain-containing protein n=1 Tax=Legionella hackeliae TaxID=449 RepID=A0A0A8UQS5_LEGHA|nr:hypothetical protein [Legionella hackeliae]KTD15425.1 hypothetical protein Lhac_0267 [Legionella hackeliae]CEK11205.1 protein of unknown function [Legionella hackeliae]STX47971.1 Uncharacterised protein [Legionella hackeliae]
MDFEKHLKLLIAEYADYDEAHFVYKNKTEITSEAKQKIEASLIALICQYLSQDGLTPENIRSHAKKLQLLFHPDKYPVSMPQSKWLQKTLSVDPVKMATCFHLVNMCEKKLTDPEAPEFHFGNILTMDALIARVKQDRDRAPTYTQRALLESILAMLTSAEDYNKQMNGNISIIWAKRISQLMPYLTTGYCLSFFLEELALLYAVTFTLSKGGSWLEKSSSTQGQTIGCMMRMFSEAIFGAVTALIARLTELNIFMVRGAINLSIDAGSGVYNLLTAAPANTGEATNQNLALIVAPQDLFGGIRFKTFELKVLAMSLELKSKQLEEQWFSGYRAGSYKNAAIKKTLRALLRIDKTDLPVNEKLEKAAEILKTLENNKYVNVIGSDSHNTINIAKTTLDILQNPNAEETKSQLARTN